MKKLLIFLAIVAVFALPVSALDESALLSRGKEYTLITPASAAYADDESFKLTDGVKGEQTEGYYYKSGAFVGFNQTNKDENGDFVIILDLGSERTNLKAFVINYLAETEAGIYAPEKLTVYVSGEFDGDYTPAGLVTIDETTEMGTSLTGTATVSTAGDTPGRFVKFVIHHKEPFEDGGTTISAGWTFLDEIEVYSSDAVPKTDDKGTAALIVVGIIAFSAFLGLQKKRKT